MSMIIVPNEWKEKDPFVSYSLYLWYDSKKSANEHHDYDSCSDAVHAMKNRIEYDKNNKIQLATIREDIIYKRTEETEISTSSPIIHFDYRKGLYI